MVIVGLRRPFGAVIVMVVWTYSQANRNRGWPFPSAVLVVPVLDLPCKSRDRHRCACQNPIIKPYIVVYIAVLAVVTTLSSSELRLRSSQGYRSLVVLLDSEISLHFTQVFHSDSSRRDWKAGGGYIVEGGNVGIYDGGDNGADSLGRLGRKIVEVHRSGQKRLVLLVRKELLRYAEVVTLGSQARTKVRNITCQNFVATEVSQREIVADFRC
jgi:hypothetical protein